MKTRRRAGAVGTAAVGVGGAGQRGYHTRRRDLANDIVRWVGHVNIAGQINRDSDRTEKPRGRASAVGAASHTRGASQGRDGTRRRDSANGGIIGIGHIDIARAVHRDPARAIEPCCAAKTVGAAHKSGLSGKSCDHARWRNLPNGLVVEISDEEISCGIDGNA